MKDNNYLCLRNLPNIERSTFSGVSKIVFQKNKVYTRFKNKYFIDNFASKKYVQGRIIYFKKLSFLTTPIS